MDREFLAPGRWIPPFAAACFSGLAVSATAYAGEPVSVAPAEPLLDKSGYTLFHPTPRELWRELSPDRPDATESPITVDAGVFSIEASYFDWRHNHGDDAFTVMAANFKVGLTHRMDLQAVIDAYTWEEPEDGGGADGFGDVQLRLKHNVWGKTADEPPSPSFPS